jgi:hypothetical protein
MFRLDEIRIHFDAPDQWTASEDKRSLRLFKELNTKWREMSQVLEGWSADGIENRSYAVLRYPRQEELNVLEDVLEEFEEI